jgi:hypothetical protein
MSHRENARHEACRVDPPPQSLQPHFNGMRSSAFQICTNSFRHSRVGINSISFSPLAGRNATVAPQHFLNSRWHASNPATFKTMASTSPSSSKPQLLRDFLNSARTALSDASKTGSSITLVTGNESAGPYHPPIYPPFIHSPHIQISTL